MSRRVAVVTGVGRRRGIGAAIASALARDGWDVAIAYWTPYDERIGHPAGDDDPTALVRELEALGRRCVAVPGDLADPGTASHLVSRAAEALGPVSGLVASHCESVDSSILDTSVESFDRHYAVNVRASWLLLKGLAEQLPASGGSAIALTSDATAGNVPYGATKGALDRLWLAGARELGARGLRTNVVNPGPVDTGWMTDEVRDSLLARQPLGRLGTPEDTARLVRFLMSDEGAWVNGQLLAGDGGFSAP